VATEFTVDTGLVTPKNIGGPRVELGARCWATRLSSGSFGIQILRGDGGDPEEFTYTVRSKLIGPFDAGEEAFLEIGCMDLPMPDYTPRTYRLRVIAIGEAVALEVRNAFIAPAPYAEAGFGGT
jgi:hypothetical protein